MLERLSDISDAEVEIIWIRYSCSMCGDYENSPIIGRNTAIPNHIEVIHCDGDKTTMAFERILDTGVE